MCERPSDLLIDKLQSPLVPRMPSLPIDPESALPQLKSNARPVANSAVLRKKAKLLPRRHQTRERTGPLVPFKREFCWVREPRTMFKNRHGRQFTTSCAARTHGAARLPSQFVNRPPSGLTRENALRRGVARSGRRANEQHLEVTLALVGLAVECERDGTPRHPNRAAPYSRRILTHPSAAFVTGPSGCAAVRP